MKAAGLPSVRDTESVRMFADTLAAVRALALTEGRTLAGQLDRLVRAGLNNP